MYYNFVQILQHILHLLWVQSINTYIQLHAKNITNKHTGAKTSIIKHV